MYSVFCNLFQEYSMFCYVYSYASQYYKMFAEIIASKTELSVK